MNTETQENQINIEDISLILSIISVCSKRGSFEPSEFKVVGALFEKLKSFLPEPEQNEGNDEGNDEGDDEGDDEGEDMDIGLISEPTDNHTTVDSAESNVINVDFNSPK